MGQLGLVLHGSSWLGPAQFRLVRHSLCWFCWAWLSCCSSGPLGPLMIMIIYSCYYLQYCCCCCSYDAIFGPALEPFRLRERTLTEERDAQGLMACSTAGRHLPPHLGSHRQLRRLRSSSRRTWLRPRGAGLRFLPVHEELRNVNIDFLGNVHLTSDPLTPAGRRSERLTEQTQGRSVNRSVD